MSLDFVLRSALTSSEEIEMSKPKRSLADIRKTMASVAEKEKNHVVWVNYEVIVTDSDTTEDEAEVSKSRELSNDEER